MRLPPPLRRLFELVSRRRSSLGLEGGGYHGLLDGLLAVVTCVPSIARNGGDGSVASVPVPEGALPLLLCRRPLSK